MKGRGSGLALLFVVFLMLLFSLFALMLASVFSNRTEIARGFYRSIQAFYLNDMGMERAKQLLSDDPSWRPPDPPGYLEEHIAIGAIEGYYRIYVDEPQPGAVEIRVESNI